MNKDPVAPKSSATNDLYLPAAQIKRVVSRKLPSGQDKNFALSKDAQLAFAEAAKVFISYVSEILCSLIVVPATSAMRSLMHVSYATPFLIHSLIWIQCLPRPSTHYLGPCML